MARNGYCCGVDTWHTLLIIISLSTYTCQHSWLIVAKSISQLQKKVVIICVFFNLVCSWTLVENIVAKGGFSTSVYSFMGQCQNFSFTFTHLHVNVFGKVSAKKLGFGKKILQHLLLIKYK